MELAPRFMLFSLLTLLTWFILLTWFTLLKLLYTAQTVACMPIYILLGKVRTLWETGNELLIKKW